MKDWNDSEMLMFGLFRQQSRVVPSQMAEHFSAFTDHQ